MLSDLERCVEWGANSWTAASTHQHKESVAVVNLERQGFEAYCPVIRRRLRHAGRVTEAKRPLFPGYVFVRINPSKDQWRPIMSTMGIRSLIKFGDHLGMLPDGFVDGLREREADGVIPLPRARDTYDPGEKVRLRDGPFDGLIATVLSCDPKGRLQLLLGLLATSVKVKSTVDNVSPVTRG
jgi:transcriptional antiterminator RfaH